MDTAPRLIVGTAGHIDHGKSRLVHALTGVHPDRLPEEQARGLTIDLGFAHTRLDDADIWFVDVPGHERFLRNMVAGAAGVDLALLIVAADDSVMPQTREHAEILQLLGVDRTILVITKCDLVDQEWVDAVASEAQELLESLQLPHSATVHTSVETGTGLDTLRTALVTAARQPSGRRDTRSWFRLPIDRSFTVPGRGTVVTGSLMHGSVEPNAELELWPGPRRVRVRDLQTHRAHADRAAGRMRLAVNLANVAVKDAWRGCELATPGYLCEARCMDVFVRSFRMPGKRIRQKPRVRVHLATRELRAELRWAQPADQERLHDTFAQLRLTEPIVASWRQPFILRDDAGERTLGGGFVLRPSSTPWSSGRGAQAPVLTTLRDGKPKERVEAAVRLAGWASMPDERLATAAGLADASESRRVLASLRDRGIVHELREGTRVIHVHAVVLAEIADQLRTRVDTYLESHRRIAGVPRGEWPGWMPRSCPGAFHGALAVWMVEKGPFRVDNNHVVPAGKRLELPPEDQRMLDAILSELAAGRFQPPTIEALPSWSAKKARRIAELVDLAAARGLVKRLGKDLWLHGDLWQEGCRKVSTEIHRRGPMTVSAIRELLGSSRKYIVPLVEQLDAAGITRRVGDVRELGPSNMT